MSRVAAGVRLAKGTLNVTSLSSMHKAKFMALYLQLVAFGYEFKKKQTMKRLKINKSLTIS